MVRLEDRTLHRASAVIAQNQLEAATLARRGTILERIHIAPPGIHSGAGVNTATDLPTLATLVTGEPDRDLSLLNGALLRLRKAWRLVVLYDGHHFQASDARTQFESSLLDFIDFVPLNEDISHRLGIRM